MATASIPSFVNSIQKLNGKLETSIEAESKSPRNRLLDMMAGWAEYTDKDAEDGFEDAPNVNEKIHALYQDAGALGFDSGITAEQEVRDFVLNKVLPVLMGK